MNEEEPVREFSTPQEAVDWVTNHVDDPYVDNERFAFEDDPIAMKEYSKACAMGCCGDADFVVLVGGRRAWVGCNYGH